MALCVTYCLRSSGCQIILQVCRLNWTCSLNSPCQLLTSLSSLGTMSHVYNKLHKHLQEHQMRELSWLIESEETDLSTKATITQCLHSTSHQNECAMDSPFFFFKGTQEKEPANFGASLGRSGLKQKLPQQRSQSLPTLGCHLTMPTLSSLCVAFNWADVLHGYVRPTTQLTDTLAMSTKTATTVMKRRHLQFWCLPQIL